MLTKLGIVSMLVCAGACLCVFVRLYALRIVSTDKILRFSDTSIYYYNYINLRSTDLFDTCSFLLYMRVVLITFKLRGSGQHSKTELLPNENQVRHNFALSSVSTFREYILFDAQPLYLTNIIISLLNIIISLLHACQKPLVCDPPADRLQKKKKKKKKNKKNHSCTFLINM